MTRPKLMSLLGGVAVILVALAIGVLPRLGVWFGHEGEGTTGHGVTGTLSGDEHIGGPFTLVNGDGETITEASFPGQYLLMYFGYTYCPDVCPSSLQAISLALQGLDPAQLDQIQPFFITVDPDRDTPEVVADYAAAFHPKLMGLTGTQEQVDAAVQAWRVYAQRVEVPGSAAHYLIDHSAFIYLMAPDGSLTTFFKHGDAPETITAGLQAALTGEENG